MNPHTTHCYDNNTTNGHCCLRNSGDYVDVFAQFANSVYPASFCKYHKDIFTSGELINKIVQDLNMPAPPQPCQ